MRQIVLDTETTGLEPNDGHRVIEIGCLELLNRQVTERTFHHYINPEREIDQGALEVHGLTLEVLAQKPLFSQIATDFVEYIQGAELIIHNAPFDIAFKRAAIDPPSRFDGSVFPTISSIKLLRDKPIIIGQPNPWNKLRLLIKLLL